MKAFLLAYLERLAATVVGALLLVAIAAPVALAVKFSLWWLAAYMVIVPLLLALNE